MFVLVNISKFDNFSFSNNMHRTRSNMTQGQVTPRRNITPKFVSKPTKIQDCMPILITASFIEVQ